MNMDSDKKVFKSERVDIMKLSYSNDYQSIINGRLSRKYRPGSKLQYFRFIAIISILESLFITNMRSYNLAWLALTVTFTLLIFLSGIRLFRGVLTSIALLMLSTLIAFGLYYIKMAYLS